MNVMQKQVRFFNLAIGATRGETSELRDRELRAKLIEEEAAEMVAAIRRGDFVEAIDGACDVLYVVFGWADASGIDLEPFFNEVHRTNMLKTEGPIREDGKRMKPPGWKPPRIAEMLAELSSTERVDGGLGSTGK